MRSTAKTKTDGKRRAVKDLAAKKTASVKGGFVVELGGSQAEPAG